MIRGEAGGQNKESSTSDCEGAGAEPSGEISPEQIEQGMAEMSRKYEEMGSELYLSESGEKRKAID